MSIRLSKLAKELNIKISIAVEYLHKNGYEIPFDPNYKIREIEEKLLNEEFNRSVIVDKDIYLDSDSSNKAIMGTKSMSNIFALKELELNSTMNIIGNIDLSSINQQTHSLIKQIEDNNIECQPQNNELLYTANNILDFKIYNTVQQEKKLTEIYLGSTSITWHFTIANYTADCTEAIPFTPFDRVICGLLTINDEMSINEIALILGLNVIDNAENNEYKDIAEYEILIEALTSLYDYGMIEKGDSYFSNCRLTEIGKEYATKGMKFKTTNSQEFSLYFDLTTNQHKKAKEVFQDLKANKIYSPIININFNDESFLKSFAESQIPDIYSEANCNSFANSKLISVSNFSFDLDAGIIYDFQLNSYSLKIYSEHAKNEYFTQVVNLYDELKNQAIQHFFSKLNPTNFTKKEIQINYEEEICGVQSDAEYLQYQNKPQDAFDIVKKYQKESAICEHIHFWQNLNEILSENITEVYFNIPEICENHKKALQNLSKLRPGLSIFITTPKADVSVTFENLFSMNNFTNANYFCCFTKEWFYYVYFYIIPYDTRSYSINVIGKIEANTRSNDISENLKLLFAEKYIPILLTEANQILDSQFDNYFTGINCAKEADKKLKQFQSYSNVLGLTPHFELLEIKKQAKIEQIKTQHKELLLQKLDAFKNETDFEKIEKLDQILKIKSQLEIIEKECFDDYFDLLKSIQSIKKTVTEQELYIKDQLLAKHYIIDTNVFVDCPEILSKIDIKHNVVLSARVIDELDKLKIKLKGEARENAEKSLKLINQKLGKKKNIKTARADLRLLPVDFNDKSPDNLILCVALMYKDKNPFLLTSDNGLQAKAKICDIPTLSLADFLFPKINNKGNVLSLPINNRTGELISLELILKAYKDASLNQKSETIDISIFSVKLRELSNRTFFHQEYGFKQFKDFCNSLTFLFDITKNEAGNGYITLKKVK